MPGAKGCSECDKARNHTESRARRVACPSDISAPCRPECAGQWGNWQASEDWHRKEIVQHARTRRCRLGWDRTVSPASTRYDRRELAHRVGDVQSRSDESDTGRCNEGWNSSVPDGSAWALPQSQGGYEIEHPDRTKVGTLWPTLFSDAERAHRIPTPVVPEPLCPDHRECGDENRRRHKATRQLSHNRNSLWVGGFKGSTQRLGPQATLRCPDQEPPMAVHHMTREQKQMARA